MVGERYNVDVVPSLDIAALNAFIDDQRVRCLWFLRRDFYPVTGDEQRRVLDAIERHGDVSAFMRARSFKACLSLPSNDESAG